MLRLYVLAYVLFLYAPIFVIALFSFHSSGALTFPFEGFSLQWYQRLLANPAFMPSLRNSLEVASATAVVTTLLGTFAALALLRLQGRAKSTLASLGFAPIALPGLFLGIGLVALFALLGVRRSLFTVTLAHVLFALPFFIETMRSRVEYFDASLEEAARDLGASPLQTFRLVTLPIIGPSILGAAILVFALSFDEFIITVFVSGNDTTLPLLIWSMMRVTVNPEINAASMIALVLSILVTALGGLLFWLQRRRAVLARNGVAL